MVGLEGGGMESFGGHHVQGVGQVPVDRLCGPAEVPPEGVGFCIARHPGHRDGVPSRGIFAVQRAPPVPLSGGNIPDLWESGHRPASQAGWYCFPRP